LIEISGCGVLSADISEGFVMSFKSKTISISVAVLMATGAAFAEDGFYLGAGLAYSQGSSSDNLFSPILGNRVTKGDFASIALTAGYRKQLGKNFAAIELQLDHAFNGELEFSAIPGASTCTSGVGAFGPYGCEIEDTLRLRAIYGTGIGNGYELFGAAGLGYVKGTQATGPTTQGDVSALGYSIGVGVQREMANKYLLRGEINYDKFNSVRKNAFAGAFPTFARTAFQVSIIKQF
jgi:opacity protein-like surface antigen